MHVFLVVICYSFLPVFNSRSDVFCIEQKSYVRQVKFSCQPCLCYIHYQAFYGAMSE